MMWQAILVDDEPYIRQMLRSMGHWEDSGFTIAAEAINGEEALRELAVPGRDIRLVLCDLRMPVMDGLELIAKAREKYPSLHFVVISAYNDFHLVREAFTLGAEEYLLKSEMTDKDIDTVLASVRGRLEADERDHLRRTSMKGTLLKSFLEYATDADRERIRRFPMLEDLPPHRDGSMVCLTLRTSQDAAPAAIAGIDRWMREKKLSGAQLSRGPGERLVLLMNQKPSAGTLSKLTAQLRGYLPSAAKGYVNIGVSRFIRDWEQVGIAAKESVVACDLCFLQGNNRIIYYQPDRRVPRDIPLRQRSDELNRLLHAPVPVAAEEAVAQFAPCAAELSVQDIPQVQELFLRYHYVLSDYALQLTDEADRSLFTSGKELVASGADLETLNRWLRRVFSTLQDSGAASSLIGKMRFYIDRNYMKDLNLAALADEFHISTTYVSRLFTQESGLSFVDYLAKIRVEKAVILIRTTNLKLYEISEQVGFHSQEHFSRTFKKQIGVSPRQYISSFRPEEDGSLNH